MRRMEIIWYTMAGLVLAPLLLVTLPRIVTATVTSADYPTQPAVFAVVLSDRDDGSQMLWNVPYASELACEAAIRGLPEWLEAVAELNDHPDNLTLLPPVTDADPRMVKVIKQGVAQFLEDENRLPHWTLSCIMPGTDPS